MDVADHVSGTFLEPAELVEVDAVAGTGVGELRAALERLVVATPAGADRGRPRLWVDRSFAARGAGTVVTGTLAGGGLAVDDEVAVLPAGRPARVRGLQTNAVRLERAGPGRRLAVNLAGLAHDQVQRGDAVVRPDQWHLTRTVDASLHVLASLDHDVGRRGAYLAYLGSGEHPAGLRVVGAQALPPGGSGFVRLHLPVALPLSPGDRYVLRESGRSETVGGGEILDVDPVRPAARARPDRSVDRVVAERGWVTPDLLERLTGERRPAQVGGYVVAPGVLAATRAEVEAAIDAAGPLGLDVAALDERRRAVVGTLPGVVVEAGRVRRPAAVDPLAGHPFLAALEAAPFAPPPPVGVDRAELRELVRRGLVVERDGIWFAATAVAQAAAVVAGLLAELPEGVTASQVRDALGTTRKYLLPLLGALDATGVTRRRGDRRIGGPNLPSAS